jgi:large subunit ribosomal protein L10
LRRTNPPRAGFVIQEDSEVLRTDKERIVKELAQELRAAETLIVADYRGLTNKQLEALRDKLLESGARFRIVKNTLTRRAAEQAGAESLLVMLEGPTAIAFIEMGGDPAAVAKALAATARETNVLTLRGGLLEGKTLSGAEIDRLATLPPVDVLRGQLVGAIVAPLTQLLALAYAPLRELHGLIDARIKQLEEQGEVLTPTPATEEEPSAEATTDAGSDEAATPAGSDSAEPAAPESPTEENPAGDDSDQTQEEE